MSLNAGIEVYRERYEIDHTSPETRVISREITFYNPFDMDVETVIVPAFQYYPGLKIFDESGNELSFYSKKDTMQFLYDVIEDEKEKKENRNDSLIFEYESILEKLKINASGNLRLIWIEFHPGNLLKGDSLKKIRLVYYDNKDPDTLSLGSSFRSRSFIEKLSFLFSIPKFPNAFTHNNELHDVFVLIRVPGCSVLDYSAEVNKKKYNPKSQVVPGFSVTNNGRTIVVRIPSDEEIDVHFEYYVSPAFSDRILPIALFGALLGVSIYISSLTGQNQFVDDNMLSIFGGFLAAVFASIGILKHQYTNRTRLWLLVTLIPISIPQLFRLLL